ncbi:translation elongation factor 2 [Coprinopsis cinerea okayama7|uniref:Translation elongation factor 2 n=1 Tax=Coprinopsis cinerea (strain Okayama-7 / 130 / ATCC MYA-4618 / FGSC 9003) TaxID=240176 RepID=A8NXT4_COPC7|nr:translation elongation factor 2 [Coprinopsis cinerea okayama7\|eukprot:XP_001837261.2 translation elongation factor 2 [Coprinopsis cinerea okayama7\
MALVAHIVCSGSPDSGKTTLTESILYRSSYLSSSGSVDTGSTTTDFLPVERERGITVQSASIPVRWKDWTFNLIDTPGHADFGMEVEGASRVIDGAVVLLDSVEGVEAQTKNVWRQLDRYGVPTRMMFFNKLDRPGASFRNAMASLLTHRFHPNPSPLTIPIASFDPKDYQHGEPGVQGLVDLVKWNIWRWAGEEATCRPLPRTVAELEKFPLFPPNHPIVPHLPVARTQLLENISMFSEDLMEHLLELDSSPDAYLGLPAEAILPHLRKAILKGEILPIVCGSALNHIGTEILMDYVGELFPSPLDVPHDPQGKNPPVRALAWKVNWDARRGWMTFVRVYSGKFSRYCTLTKQSVLQNASRNQREKVSKLLMLYASDVEEVDELPVGSVGVVLGLRHTRTGDTLVSLGGNAEQRSVLRDITPPPAVISTSVIPHSHSDLDPVQAALDSLARTDPSVRIDTQEGQLLVHALGTLHLEIVENKLRDIWGANFEFGQRRVSYREGLGDGTPSDTWATWSSDIAGKPVTVTLPLEIRAMTDEEVGDPVWDGNCVLGPTGAPLPAPEAIQSPRLAGIAEGIANALSNSPHSGLAMTKVFVRITGPPTEAFPAPVLNAATVAVLRQRVRDASMGPLFEPYVHLKVSVPEKSFGLVISDLTEHGGEVLELGEDAAAFDGSSSTPFSEEGLYIPPDWLSPSGNNATASRGQAATKHVIHASAPLSRMFDYSSRLRAITEGHGSFEMAIDCFRQVSEPRRMEILKEIGRA